MQQYSLTKITVFRKSVIQLTPPT